MSYQVRVTDVAARRTAVVAATTTTADRSRPWHRHIGTCSTGAPNRVGGLSARDGRSTGRTTTIPGELRTEIYYLLS